MFRSRTNTWIVGGLVAAYLFLAVPVPAEEGTPGAGAKPAVAGPEVTLKGVLMWEQACVPKPKLLGSGEQQVLFAVEGTPEVNAEIDRLMKDHYCGDSLNADQALKILERFNQRLKYYLVPGEIVSKKEGQWSSPPKAVTGVVSEKDGRKWITVGKCENATLKYPDKMRAADKPFVMPDKEPLILKINDSLLLKCILLPAGKFMMGAPFYVVPRWQDEPPHMVTLTRPFYLAEIPVTQEMYEAVMAGNPSTVKDPKRPVRNVPCGDICKFCRIVSEKNGGRKLRLPTQAEWEWACRVGTSDPPFIEKYKDQVSSGKTRGDLLPVKSKQPNAWGLYDMVSNGPWEITQDNFTFSGLEDAVDPYYPTDCASGKKHTHFAKGCLGFKVSNHEGVGMGGAKDDTDYVTTKFRVLVEATPEEIAGMEKSANK